MKKTIIAILFIVLLFIIGYFYHIYIQNIAVDFYIYPEKTYTETKKLHFLHWDDFPDKILEGFNKKYPDSVIEYEQYGSNDYSNIQKMKIASGEDLDIMGIMRYDYTDFTSKKYLVDISLEGFLNNYTDMSKYELIGLSEDGKIYAIPYKGWVLGIWYNKILFTRYNLSVPENYYDLIDICRKLKKIGIDPLVLGVRDDEVCNYLLYLRFQELEEKYPNLFNKNKAEDIDWNSLDFETVFYDIDYFLSNGFLKENSYSLTQKQAFVEFVKGGAAMIIMKDSSIELASKDDSRVFHPGVFPIPYNIHGKVSKVTGNKADFLIGIYSKTKYIHESKQFLEYISIPEIAQTYTEATKTVTNVINTSQYNLEYSYLWDPIRRMEFISPKLYELSPETQNKNNALTKEFILNIKTYSEMKQELKFDNETD